MLYIVKRDGSIVEFDKNKIINAINKAFIEVDQTLYETDTAKDIAEEIYDYALQQSKRLTVEDIQDQVEWYLMKSERKDVAQAYIRYRYKKEVSRQLKDTFFKAITEKLRGENIENANANMDENSFSGRIGAAADVMTKEHALTYCVSPMAKKNHEENMIYIHDLNSYTIGDHNCLTTPLDKLLAEGFKVRQTDVRPAGSVNTAFQLMAVIFQLQSLCQFGGISAGHIDWTMVPYVRKSFRKHWNDGLKYVAFWDVDEKDYVQEDKSIKDYPDCDDYKDVYKYAYDMTIREIHQAVEGAYHNLKILGRLNSNIKNITI